jgi:hypothetical protein
MVIGSRYVRRRRANWPLRPALLSRFANLYTRVLLRVPVRDCTGGLPLLQPRGARGDRPVRRARVGYSFLEEMVWRVHHAGFAIREIPIVFEDRRLGVLEDRSGRDPARRAPRTDHRRSGAPTRDARRLRLTPPQHRSTADRRPPHGLLVGEALEALEGRVERRRR